MSELADAALPFGGVQVTILFTADSPLLEAIDKRSHDLGIRDRLRRAGRRHPRAGHAPH